MIRRILGFAGLISVVILAVPAASAAHPDRGTFFVVDWQRGVYLYDEVTLRHPMKLDVVVESNGDLRYRTKSSEMNHSGRLQSL